MTALQSPSVPVSWGELLDKLTILEIKAQRIASPAARANIAREQALLHAAATEVLAHSGVQPLLVALRAVNQRLWDIEDAIRQEDAQARFGRHFIRLARAVYHENDARAAIKREINAILGSELVEEKSYWSAAEPPLVAAETGARGVATCAAPAIAPAIAQAA